MKYQKGKAIYQTKKEHARPLNRIYSSKKIEVFVDANILVSVLNKEYPLFTYTSRILSLPMRRNRSFYISGMFGHRFYLREKNPAPGKPKQKIKIAFVII